MENEEKKSGFKVEDKRQFNSDGSDRGATEERVAFDSSRQEDERSVENHEQQEDVTLSSFVMSLATQGMMQLGEMKAPDGFNVPTDIEHAKQTIDLISMLKEKTKGNLDEFEIKLFEEVLYSLRIAYVKRKGTA